MKKILFLTLLMLIGNNKTIPVFGNSADEDNEWSGEGYSATLPFIVLTGATLAEAAFLGLLQNNEYSFMIGVGNASWNYHTSLAPAKIAANASADGYFGIGLKHSFNDYIGLRTGVEGTFKQSSIVVSDYSLQIPIGTPSGLTGDLLLQADYSSINESQKILFLEFPLMLQINMPLNEKRSSWVYVAGGAKFSLPVFTQWSQDVGVLTTRGYNSADQTYYENRPEYGFSTRTHVKSSGSFELINSSLSFIVETGFQLQLAENKRSIYFGVYSDIFRPNNISVTPDRELLQYNAGSPPSYQYNSVLQDQNINALPASIKPFSFGLKIRYAIAP